MKIIKRTKQAKYKDEIKAKGNKRTEVMIPDTAECTEMIRNLAKQLRDNANTKLTNDEK